MLCVDRRFCDLNTIVDDIHDLFEWWGADAIAAGALDEVRVEIMKLAIHEWVANLVQHASFAAAPPLIKLALAPDVGRIHCVIEDNSDGFDFLQQIARQQYHLERAPEPPDRGRGLLMMIASTEHLSYRPVRTQHSSGMPEPRLQRLEFWISPLDDQHAAFLETDVPSERHPSHLPERIAPDKMVGHAFKPI
jgi:serine/threonine-protein kinase RsbW